MTTKIEIVGQYTPGHDGVYVIDSGNYAKNTYVKVNVHSVVDNYAFVTPEDDICPIIVDISVIYNAREVPVAQEFWVNEYSGKDGLFHNIFDNEATAHRHKADTFLRTIHVREVLSGDDQ